MIPLLADLVQVNGTLRIGRLSHPLLSMAGLFGGLHTVLGDVYVVDTQLTSIEDAFPNVTTIGGRLYVHSNDDITNCSERGFKNLASLDGADAEQPTSLNYPPDLRPHMYVVASVVCVRLQPGWSSAESSRGPSRHTCGGCIAWRVVLRGEEGALGVTAASFTPALLGLAFSMMRCAGGITPRTCRRSAA